MPLFGTHLLDFSQTLFELQFGDDFTWVLHGTLDCINTTFKCFKSGQPSHQSAECPRRIFITDHEDNGDEEDPKDYDDGPIDGDTLPVGETRLVTSQEQPIINVTVSGNGQPETLSVHRTMSVSRVYETICYLIMFFISC